MPTAAYAHRLLGRRSAGERISGNGSTEVCGIEALNKAWGRSTRRLGRFARSAGDGEHDEDAADFSTWYLDAMMSGATGGSGREAMPRTRFTSRREDGAVEIGFYPAWRALDGEVGGGIR
jgi:hypothetical protein